MSFGARSGRMTDVSGRSSDVSGPRFSSRTHTVDAVPMATVRKLLFLCFLCAMLVGVPPAHADAASRDQPLRFGIYPGSGVGAVLAASTANHDSPEQQLDALSTLRGTRALVVHLYTEIDGTPAFDGHLEWAAMEVERYRQAGFLVEFVLRYRPVSRNARRARIGFTRGVRKAVKVLAKNPALVGLQITNEANMDGAPDAGDGAYPGARRALVSGVIAADRQLRRMRVSRVKVGFNVAGSVDEKRFWRDLKRHGGRRFAKAVDYVGIDVYPGTWPTQETPSPAAVRQQVEDALKLVRRSRMPSAGLGNKVAIHVTENGFPTGQGRTGEDQRMVMTESIRAISRLRGPYNITDYRWFDLKDSDSASKAIEHQYGLLRDDGTQKPAFAALAELVTKLGAV